MATGLFVMKIEWTVAYLPEGVVYSVVKDVAAPLTFAFLNNPVAIC